MLVNEKMLDEGQLLTLLEESLFSTHFDPERQVVWVWKEQTQATFALPKSSRQSPSVVVVEGKAAGSVGYSGIFPLLQESLESLLAQEEEQPWLATIAPEILYLFPEYEAHSLFYRSKKLDDIALSPSRRRLHKESEAMFRVTQMVTAVIIRALERKNTPVLLVFDNVERLDMHSIRCFARITACLRHRTIMVLATAAQPQAEDPRFQVTVPADLAPFFPLHELRSQLLKKIVSSMNPWVFRLEGKEKPSSAVSSPPWLQGLQDRTVEMKTTQRLLQEVEAEEGKLDEAVIQSCLETTVHTQNFEHALFLIAYLTPHFPRFSDHLRLEIDYHLAMCYTFMNQFETGLAIYKRALGVAKTPIQQAETRLYIALLYTKRMQQPQVGRAYIEEALSLLEKEEGGAVEVERTWLHNLRALTYVEEKDIEKAYENCRKALTFIKKGERSSDGTHIKINLLSNVTVLDEYTKKLPRALKNWGVFEQYLHASNPVFAKHYYYRKGGLLYKINQYKQAYDSFLHSFRYAEDLADHYHSDVIARALGSCCYQQENYRDACYWYQQSLLAKQALLQEPEEPRVAVAAAICLMHSGKPAESHRVIEKALYRQPTGAAAERGTRFLKDNKGEWEVYADWAIEAPATKLNRPFTITNLY